MSRYNHESKISQVMGYVQDAKYPVNAVDFQGWRQVIMYKKGVTGMARLFMFHPIRLKSTQKGLLIDITNAISDSNTQLFLPLYPLETILELKWNEKVQFRDSIDVEKVLLETGGMMFYTGVNKLPIGSSI